VASNGETNIDKLIEEVRRPFLPDYLAVQRLAIICELQQQRIKALETEIFDRCMDLRQRVAAMEQTHR
jgi:hypothetical protein